MPGVGHYHWEIIRNKVNSLKFKVNTSKIEEPSIHNKYVDKLVG